MAACTKVEVELLISLLEAKRELWDVRDPSYQNRSKKESALHSIVEDMKPSVPNTILTSVKDVRSKIQILRGQYRKELRLIESSKRSRAGVDEVRKPTLWCFDQLQFLKPLVEIRQGRSNLENCPPQNNVTVNDDHLYAQNVEGGDDSFNEPVCSSTSKAARKRKATEALTQEVQDLVQVVSTISRPRRYEWFGEQMVEALNNLKNEEVVDDTIETLQRALRDGKNKDKEVSNRSSTSSDMLRRALYGVIEDGDIL